MNTGDTAHRNARVLKELPDPVALDDAGWVDRSPRRFDFYGAISDTDAAPSALSLLLLDLYAAAIRSQIGEFERMFLRLLADYVPFDTAWTGLATLTPAGPVVHNSFLYGLPIEFFTDWKQVRHCDTLGDLDRLVHGKAAVASVLDANIDLRFRDWAAKYGLAYMLCICTLDNRFGLTTFLSVYRQALNRPFSSEEKRRLEEIIPHLAAALEINRSNHLVRLQAETMTTTARAICDSYGLLHQMDDSFAHALAAEWPEWAGSKLPEALIEQLRHRSSMPYVGTAVHIRLSKVAGLYLVESRPRSLLDRLSPQELTAIRHFGEGISYKEVARRMDISPTTVRHYLRCAYKKLRMHDKSQIASILNLTN